MSLPSGLWKFHIHFFLDSYTKYSLPLLITLARRDRGEFGQDFAWERLYSKERYNQEEELVLRKKKKRFSFKVKIGLYF